MVGIIVLWVLSELRQTSELESQRAYLGRKGVGVRLLRLS